MKETKDSFILSLVNHLESRNIDKEQICFMVSIVDREIEKCEDFMNGIKHGFVFNRYEADTSGGYTNGKIEIIIEKPNDEKKSEDWMDSHHHDFHYVLEFLEDERPWGYCECNENEDGYREEYRCCGNGCDWSAPSFRLEKVVSVGYYRWDGMESDYWNFKDKFFESDEDHRKNLLKKK